MPKKSQISTKEHTPKLRKLPAIFCDIDGVVLKGHFGGTILLGNS